MAQHSGISGQAEKFKKAAGQVNPLILIAAKTAWWFWWNLLAKSIFQEIFEGEMYIRILPTTLLQMFSKSILNFWVIVKNIKDPDNNFKSNS